MAEDRAISVRLNVANYSYWSNVIKNVLVGKGLWGYVTGSTVPPDPKAEGYATALAKWESENAKVLTWLHNSSEPIMGKNLSKYATAKEAWDYLRLKGIYLESIFYKRYELEMSIQNAKQQDKSIQEFYDEMTHYWDQLALIEPPQFQSRALYVKYREQLRLAQFLLGLRTQFEPLRDAILHRSHLPSVNSAVRELIAEETRFKVASIASPSQSS